MLMASAGDATHRIDKRTLHVDPGKARAVLRSGVKIARL